MQMTPPVHGVHVSPNQTPQDIVIMAPRMTNSAFASGKQLSGTVNNQDI